MVYHKYGYYRQRVILYVILLLVDLVILAQACGAFCKPVKVSLILLLISTLVLAGVLVSFLVKLYKEYKDEYSGNTK